MDEAQVLIVVFQPGDRDVWASVTGGVTEEELEDNVRPWSGDLNFNRLIPGTIRSALQDQAPIIRSDGRYIRDYFYVGDAANAYLSLAENLPQEPIVGQAFNFSTGVPVTVLELVHTILDVMDQAHLVPTVLNEASNEILEQTLDCTKAKELLGWQSEYTLENALRETVEWYRRWHERSGGLVKGLSRSA